MTKRCLINKTLKVDEFGSSVNFAVRPWANSEHYWDVYFFMQEQIKKGFDKANIEIPFPQHTVHLQK